MPNNTSSHRIIVIAGSTAHRPTQICRSSKALLQRPAHRRIVVICNGQSIAHNLHVRQASYRAFEDDRLTRPCPGAVTD